MDCQHGKCIAPEQCECNPSYGGASCNETVKLADATEHKSFGWMNTIDWDFRVKAHSQIIWICALSVAVFMFAMAIKTCFGECRSEKPVDNVKPKAVPNNYAGNLALAAASKSKSKAPGSAQWTTAALDRSKFIVPFQS